MRHVGILTRYRVWLNFIALLVLPPAALYLDFLALTVSVGQTVEFDKHVVFVGREIAALVVYEIENYLVLFIECFKVFPFSYDNAELLVTTLHKPLQLLAPSESHWV